MEKPTLVSVPASESNTSWRPSPVLYGVFMLIIFIIRVCATVAYAVMATIRFMFGQMPKKGFWREYKSIFDLQERTEPNQKLWSYRSYAPWRYAGVPLYPALVAVVLGGEYLFIRHFDKMFHRHPRPVSSARQFGDFLLDHPVAVSVILTLLFLLQFEFVSKALACVAGLFRHVKQQLGIADDE